MDRPSLPRFPWRLPWLCRLLLPALATAPTTLIFLPWLAMLFVNDRPISWHSSMLEIVGRAKRPIAFPRRRSHAHTLFSGSWLGVALDAAGPRSFLPKWINF